MSNQHIYNNGSIIGGTKNILRNHPMWDATPYHVFTPSISSNEIPNGRFLRTSDAVFSFDVVLPDPFADGTLFECGGSTRGTGIGIIDSGATLVAGCGRSNASQDPTDGYAGVEVSTSLLTPGAVGTLTYDCRISPGRLRLWWNNIFLGEGHSAWANGDSRNLSNDLWSGTDPAQYYAAATLGKPDYLSSTQWQGEVLSSMRYYENTLVDDIYETQNPSAGIFNLGSIIETKKSEGIVKEGLVGDWQTLDTASWDRNANTSYVFNLSDNTETANHHGVTYGNVTADYRGFIEFDGANSAINVTAGKNLVRNSTYNPNDWDKIETTGTASVISGIDDPHGGFRAVRFTHNNDGNVLLRVYFDDFTPNGTDEYSLSFWAREISGTGSLSHDVQDQFNTSYESSLVTNKWVRIVKNGMVLPNSSMTRIDLISDTDINRVTDYYGVQLEQANTVSSYVQTPFQPYQYLTTEGSFTACAWVYIPSSAGGNEMVLGNRWRVSTEDGNPQDFWKIEPNRFEWAPNGNPSLGITNPLTKDKWIYAAFVKDKTKFRGYEDGALISARDDLGSMGAGLPFHIGGDQYETTQWSTVKVAAVQYYNRALSVQELEQNRRYIKRNHNYSD